MLTKLGISTASGAMIGAAADDRAGHRAEAGLGELPVAPAGELGRHLVPPVRAAGAAGDHLHRLRRNDSSTAFLSHWLTRHSPSTCSATRASPLSSMAIAALDRQADVAARFRGRLGSRSPTAASISGSQLVHSCVSKIASSHSRDVGDAMVDRSPGR